MKRYKVSFLDPTWDPAPRMQRSGIGDLRTFRITWYWKDDPDQVVQEMLYQAPTLTDARKESRALLKRLHPDRVPVRVRSERK